MASTRIVTSDDADTTPGSAESAAETDAPRRLSHPRGLSDNVFRIGAHGGGVLVLAIMTLVGLFLAVRGAEAIAAAG
ncbi:hypothetical protein, partial [Escherichia coli]